MSRHLFVSFGFHFGQLLLDHMTSWSWQQPIRQEKEEALPVCSVIRLLCSNMVRLSAVHTPALHCRDKQGQSALKFQVKISLCSCDTNIQILNVAEIGKKKTGFKQPSLLTFSWKSSQTFFRCPANNQQHKLISTPLLWQCSHRRSSGSVKSA